MEIGKKLLSDSEFSRLWGILYQEFYNLSITNKCDATLVYNTIYIICTSGSSLEDKLYWKIGDFLYSRCKIHRDQILKSNEYLDEYVLRFEEYQRLVESVHSLGSFLNGCIKGRKLNDFGYLLWDRMVIQNLRSIFFEDVLEYSGSVSKIIHSFECIIPDINNKLLYYKEKYEKIALLKIRSRYDQIFYTSILDFCKITKEIINRERIFMSKYLLPNSYGSVQIVLEDCLFSKNYYELLLNIICFLDQINFENITGLLVIEITKCRDCILSFIKSNQEISFEPASYDRLQNQFYSQSHSQFYSQPHDQLYNQSHNHIQNQSQNHIQNQSQNHIKNQSHNQSQLSNDMLFQINKTKPINYETITGKEYEKIRIFVENEFKNNRVISSIQGWINKRKSGDSERFLPSDSYYNTLMESIGALDAGFILLKKAYALYVEMIIKLNSNLLESTVKNVFLLFESLDIFPNNDCKSMLISIFKAHLQRSKPCFMKRFCDYIETSSDLFNQKPFEQSSKIFQIAMDLIYDKNEFMNMYQNALKERILSNNKNIMKEYEILRFMNIPSDNKLYKMLDEISHSKSGLKILNSVNWNIDPVNPTFKIPDELIKRILEESSNIRIRDKNEEGSIKFKILLNNNNNNGNNGKKVEEGILQLAHQYSKVKLEINKKIFILNIYQYGIIDILIKSSENFETLSVKMKIPQEILKSALQSLINCRIIKFIDNLYELNDRFEMVSDQCDISKLDETRDEIPDICIDSYIQTLGAKVLKRIKKSNMNNFVEELKNISKIEVSEEMIHQSIVKLVDKGIAEARNNIIEFIF